MTDWTGAYLVGSRRRVAALVIAFLFSIVVWLAVLVTASLEKDQNGETKIQYTLVVAGPFIVLSFFRDLMNILRDHLEKEDASFIDKHIAIVEAFLLHPNLQAPYGVDANALLSHLNGAKNRLVL